MERFTSEESRAPVVPNARGVEWLKLQGLELVREWVQYFTMNGLSKGEAESLYAHWFPCLGDVYKKTTITREAFKTEMFRMRDDLDCRLSQHRWLMGQKACREVGWGEVVEDIVTHASPGRIEVQPEDQVAFFRAYFPMVEDPSHQSYMTYVFQCAGESLEEAECDQIEHIVSLSGHVQEATRNRIAHLFPRRAA